MEGNSGDSTPPETVRDDALARFEQLARAKFDEGQKAHGGSILDRNLVEEIENEAIDLWFYVAALRRKLDEIKQREQPQSKGGEV